MDMNDRIIELIGKLKLSKSAFASSIGVSPAIITHIGNGRNKVGTDLIEKVAATFPQVSLQWLFTGRGSAFGDSEALNAQLIVEQHKDLKRQLRNVQTEINVLKNKLDQFGELFN